MSDAVTQTKMCRINVTGNAGVGKTTVASKLSKALDLELIGLDAVVWQAGWQRTPGEERQRQEEKIAARQSWVVDGVSATIRQEADTIVFLDYGRWVAFSRCLRRNWWYLFRSRPGLPERCPEILILPTLIKIIWQFPHTMRPKLLAEVDAYRETKRIVHIRNDEQLEAFLEEVSKMRPAQLHNGSEAGPGGVRKLEVEE